MNQYETAKAPEPKFFKLFENFIRPITSARPSNQLFYKVSEAPGSQTVRQTSPTTFTSFSFFNVPGVVGQQQQLLDSTSSTTSMKTM